MPWNDSTKVLTSPFTKIAANGQGDLQKALGRSVMSHIQLVGDIDANGNRINAINKWAKYKPFRSPNVIVTAQHRIDAHYGLSVVEYTELGTPSTVNSFLKKLIDGELLWDYLPPRGENTAQGIHEPYRAMDFDGYFAAAVNPIGDVDSDNIPINPAGEATIAWDLVDVENAYNLQLSDIKINGSPLTSYYLGVLLYKSASNYRLVTSSNVLGSGDVQINLTNATSLAGTWRMYPFFSSRQYNIGDSFLTGSYVSAGWDKPYHDITLRLASQSMAVYAYGTWNDAHTRIEFFIEAYNEDSVAKTIFVEVFLRRNQDPGTEPTGESTLATYDAIQLTVPAGGFVVYPSGGATLLWAPGVAYDSSYIYWLGASITTGTYAVNYVQVEQPDTPID